MALPKADWTLMRPCLRQDQRPFGIELYALLTSDGKERSPAEVYRKVEAQPLAVLT